MKKIIWVFIIVFSYSLSYGQEAGMRVHAGVISMINKDKAINPEGTSLSGYTVGVSGRIMSGQMAFLLSGRYTSVSKLATSDFKISGHTSNLNLMNGRVGLDFSLFDIGNIVRFRTKALGSFDIVLATSKEGLLPPGYRFNDGWLGAVTGLGVDIGPFILDFEYEIGILNAYYQKKDAKFNSWSLTAGFFF